MAIGPDGSYVIGGGFIGDVDFDPGTAQDIRRPNGDFDVFITKFNADDSMAWTRTLGGAEYDLLRDLTVAPDGSVIATGYYWGSVDLDPGPGVSPHDSGPGSESFILKLSAAGSFVWVRTLAPMGPDLQGSATGPVAVAPDGSIYAAGGWGDPDPGTGTGGGSYAVKLTPAGALAWARTTSGSEVGTPIGMTVAPNGVVWIAGAFSGSCDFDTGPGVDTRVSNGYDDAFVLKVGANGDYVGAFTLGSGSTWGDTANRIVFDSDGSAYVGGSFSGAVDLDPGPGDATAVAPNETYNSYVLKLGPTGATEWVQPFLGIGAEPAAAKGGGVILVAVAQPGAGDLTGGLFLGRLSPDGRMVPFVPLIRSRYASTTVASDGTKFILHGSQTYGGDFDPGPATDTLAPGGMFVSRYAF